jgi:hypothetical protein
MAVVLALAACGTDASGFVGDYETVTIAKQTGGCGGVGDPQPIPDNVHWFRLDDVDTKAGPLVGYYVCQDLGACQADYDLYRSFGKGSDSWLTTVSTAIDPGCTLQYRERTLSRVDDMTIQIDDVLYSDVDPSLTGDACAIAEAKRRGTSMPCVEQTTSLADARMAP